MVAADGAVVVESACHCRRKVSTLVEMLMAQATGAMRLMERMILLPCVASMSEQRACESNGPLFKSQRDSPEGACVGACSISVD